MLQALPASVGPDSEPPSRAVIEGVVDEDDDIMPELEDASEISDCSCSCHMPKAAAAPPTRGSGRMLYESAKQGSMIFAARHEYYAVPGAQLPIAEGYSAVDYVVCSMRARYEAFQRLLAKSGGSPAGDAGRIDGEVCETAWASAVEREIAEPFFQYDMACTGFDGRTRGLKAKM